MQKTDKIYVAGHNGLVGSAITNKLKEDGFENLVLASSRDVDLRDQAAVKSFFSDTKPDYVILAAAKVGGIHANNTYPAEFLYDNLMIQNNVVKSAYEQQVKRLLFLGSSCIYPRNCPQPMQEHHLLTGELEKTNEAYAIAKIAGIKLCESFNKQYGTDYVSVMPTNLYGPNDNFDLENSHVLPALIRKFHQAKLDNAEHVTIWGTGTPKREFLHVNDMADACCYLMGLEKVEGILNIGTGEEVTIKELAVLVKSVVGFNGKLVFDTKMPDGTPRKLLDVDKLTGLGWQSKISLEEGIAATYDWFCQQDFIRGK